MPIMPPAPNHARYRRPEPSSATPQPSCPSVLSRSRCCTALLADDSLPRDLDILAPLTSGAWAASIRSASWQSDCEANGSGSLAHHGRVELGLLEQRQKDLPAHRDPGVETGRAHRERHQMNLRVGNFFSASVFSVFGDGVVARFFFHVANGHALRDDAGMDLNGLRGPVKRHY